MTQERPSICFGWDPRQVNPTLRRLLGVAIDARSMRQGYAFTADHDKLTVVAHGDHHDYALVHVPIELQSEPGRFFFPAHTLADLLRLRHPVSFEADAEGELRYVDDAGDGFRWAPAKPRELGPITAERGIRPLGLAAAGLLGFALGMVARFLRILRVPQAERTVGVRFGEESPGFEINAVAERHAFRFASGESRSLSPVVGVTPPRQKALATFFRSVEDVVKVSAGELRVAVRDSLGNGYAFPRAEGPRGFPAVSAHETGIAHGHAAARSVAHLERAGHELLALRISPGEGRAVIGVRGTEGRFLGEHPWTSATNPQQVVGVDVESYVLRALLAGVGPGDISVGLGPSPARAGNVALQVQETRFMHIGGRAPRAKDPASELTPCTIERATTVPAGGRGAVHSPTSASTRSLAGVGPIA
jgi:hypothetical protein